MLLEKLLDEMLAFSSISPRPKDLKIATPNNKLRDINYSSHKSSNSASAKHTFTSIAACASSLLPCSPVRRAGFAGSLQRQLSHKCSCLMYVHDWRGTDHVSTCCHLHSAECFGCFPTSLMENNNNNNQERPGTSEQ